MPALGLLLLLVPQSALANPSFEEPGEPPPGWAVLEGARSADAGGTSTAAAEDVAGAPEGARALRLAGDAGTAAWRLVHQDVAVEPGERVRLELSARAEGMRLDEGQFDNAYASLAFLRDGRPLSAAYAPLDAGGEGAWCRLALHALAPEGADAARVALFLSKSGTALVDDVRLQVTPSDPEAPEARAAAFDALVDHLARTWPFWGLPGKPDDPSALAARHRESAVAADGRDAFLERVAAMLGELDDVHVWLETPRGPVWTVPPGEPPPGPDPRAVEERLAQVVARGPRLLAGRLPEGPGYVRIASFVLSPSDLEGIEAALDALADAPALVLDVRRNGGGDEAVARRIASRFAVLPVVYARSRLRDPCGGPGALGPAHERVLEPRDGAAADVRPVAVLQGPGCVSSTEGFLLMARALPTVTTVGLPSRGASGNPGAFALLPDATVHASRWRSLAPDGEEVEGTGVPPEVRVEPTPEGDAVLDRALELLAER